MLSHIHKSALEAFSENILEMRRDSDVTGMVDEKDILVAALDVNAAALCSSTVPEPTPSSRLRLGYPGSSRNAHDSACPRFY
jgi:hypothetical protein